MLDQLKELDAVSVITPNRTHRPLALQVLQAGRHVFCEKPPALNAAEVSQMKDASESAGKTLMFNFNNRARPESYALRKYIEAGEVGRSIQPRQNGLEGLGYLDLVVGLQTRNYRGWPLIDLLHMVDLLCTTWTTLKPSCVLAQTFSDFIQDKNFKGPWGIPDVADGVTDVESASHGFIKFKTGQDFIFPGLLGRNGQARRGFCNLSREESRWYDSPLFGSDGLDETAIDDCELYVQEHGRSVNRSIITEPNEDMGRIRSAENFVRTIAGEERPLNTPDQALALMKIIDATYESAQTGIRLHIVK